VIKKALSRRGFIRAGACLGTLIILFRSFAQAKTGSGKSVGNVVVELTNLVSNKISAAEIGKAYLVQSGSEKDLRSIANALSHACGGPHGAPDKMKEALCSRIRGDFAQGRTVRVQGWVLSQTEASVCALVAATAAS